MRIEGSYSNSKIKPKKTTVEGILFDSEFESYVYQHIRLSFPKHLIRVHAPIPLFPSNRHMCAYTWSCDFQVNVPGWNSPLYIEAKGLLTEDFRLTLKAVAASKPEVLDNLIVVHQKEGLPVTRKVKTLTLPGLHQFLSNINWKA